MLYLVPTPIGNLKDITLRALDVLKEVDVVLAEDTRTSSKLLNHYQIHTPLTPYHQHNEHQVLQHLISQCRSCCFAFEQQRYENISQQYYRNSKPF